MSLKLPRVLRDLLAIAGVPLIACVASCGGDSSTAVSTPRLSLEISPSSITLGQSATATWSAVNASTCAATGAWTGPRNASGTETLTPSQPGTLSYSLSCAGAGGTTSASAPLTVVAPPPPTVSIAASRDSAFVGETIRLVWSSTNAGSCIASGAWTGSRAAAGSLDSVRANAGTGTFTLACSGAGGTTTASVTVVGMPPAASLANSFVPNAITIPTSEGSPYTDGDLWFGSTFAQTAYGYGPTKVIRLYICLNGRIHFFDCSQSPPLTAPLSAATLAGIDSGIARFENTGSRLLLRFIYNFGPIGAPDAPIDVIAAHIDQLAPVVLKHRDHVFALEAGFIGTWGEWHHSTNGNDTPANRKTVLDKELSYFGGVFPVLVRYPSNVLDYAGATPAPSLGLHDDYYDSNSGDGGTFVPASTYTASQLQNYTAQVSTTTMLIGEFGELNQTQQTCASLDAFSFTYHPQSISINIYPPEIGTYLESQGCATSFMSKVGTRIVLRDASLLGGSHAGDRIHVSLSLVNAGYGRVIRQRPATLVFSSSGVAIASIPIPIGSLDLRTLSSSPGSIPTPVQFDVRLPAGLPAGQIDVALLIPDPAPSLTSNPAYALPLNSLDETGKPIFDAVTGRNRLGAFVVK